MKNKLSDLNDHLFAAIERLNDEDMPEDKINIETNRARAICSVAESIIKNASVALKATRLAVENGYTPTADSFAGIGVEPVTKRVALSHNQSSSFKS